MARVIKQKGLSPAELTALNMDKTAMLLQVCFGEGDVGVGVGVGVGVSVSVGEGEGCGRGCGCGC